MIDTPKCQITIKHRVKHVSVFLYFIIIERIINTINKILYRFEEPIDEIDDMSSTDNLIQSEDEEDELKEDGEEVDDEPDSDGGGFQTKHDHEAQDISAGQEDERNCKTAFFDAIAGY